jgi:hypothetical protein
MTEIAEIKKFTVHLMYEFSLNDKWIWFKKKLGHKLISCELQIKMYIIYQKIIYIIQWKPSYGELSPLWLS